MRRNLRYIQRDQFLTSGWRDDAHRLCVDRGGVEVMGTMLSSPDAVTAVSFAESKLDPDLVEWVEEGSYGRRLYHPLVSGSVDGVELVENANCVYRQKVENVEAAYRERNWFDYVFLYERPYRAERLFEIGSEIVDDAAYWRLVADAWTDTENAWQEEETWYELLFDHRPDRQAMMDEAERSTLKGLSDPVPVFRGFHRDGRDRGLSWTTDREQAMAFALRFASIEPGYARVAVGVVPKPCVIAYLNERSEREVLALPEDVTIETIESVE